MNRKYLIITLTLLWILLILVEQAIALVKIRSAPNGKLIFEAQDATLTEIAKEITVEYNIEIKGLEQRKTEKITLSFDAESREALLKSLLRHLGIKNYALEFTDEALTRLVVVPEATSDDSSWSVSPEDSIQQKKFVEVVEIQSVVASSQAEWAGLLAGDLIIEYDGTRIKSATQLLSEVEKKTTESQIEMVIVRQNKRSRLVISPGFIGVRIITKRIPLAEFNTFH